MGFEKHAAERLIFVGTSDSPTLWDAVELGGGTPTTSIATAQAAIWTGGGAAYLAELLHEGIEWLQLPSAGAENYKASGAVSQCRTTTSASPAYAATVAEHALAMLLSCVRRLHNLSRLTTWSVPEISRLRGSTVAIIGCGRIGEALMVHLEPFGVTVLASTRTGRPVDGAAETVTPDQHDDILARADCVVVAAPATPSTKSLIGESELAAMKPTAFLVNVARGSLVDSAALEAALRDGAIAGAALDVTDPEPLPDGHPFWTMDEVLITPHTANPDAWDAELLAPLVRSNVERFINGDQLLGIVDPNLGY